MIEATPQAVLRRSRGAFFAVGFLSALVNILTLTGPLFMLQTYELVLPSASVQTLIGLSIVVLFLFLFLALFDLIRNRILVRIGQAFEIGLSDTVFEAALNQVGRGRSTDEPKDPVRDLDQVRSFLTGPGVSALFDLPWLPFYIAICFLFHFWIGVTVVVGAIVLTILAVFTETLTRKPLKDASRLAAQRSRLVDSGRRNVEVLKAMGMIPRAVARWNLASQRYRVTQRRPADIVGTIGALSRVARMILQSSVLAVGALLVIEGQANFGVIIAGAIVAARGVAPVEQAIMNWRSFVTARQSYRRLKEVIATMPAEPERLELPPPQRELSVSGLHLTPPGDKRLVIQGLTFRLQAGDALGVIGPSGSGKSSLARALVSVWAPAAGSIRIDGVDLSHMPPDRIGRAIGYLPQNVDLFAGTVAQNIARLEADPPAAAVVAAAKGAGVHDFILGLPQGYETQIGEEGGILSAGQRQRMALARALYGDPFLLVLDEPNSNLDLEGDRALAEAILATRSRGGIVVIIAHRPSALTGVDLALAIVDGRNAAFGPKEDVLRRLAPRPQQQPAASGLKIVSEGTPR